MHQHFSSGRVRAFEGFLSPRVPEVDRRRADEARDAVLAAADLLEQAAVYLDRVPGYYIPDVVAVAGSDVVTVELAQSLRAKALSIGTHRIAL